MPELPSFRLTEAITWSRQRRRWSASLASYTQTGGIDVLITVEATGMNEAREVAEAIVALTKDGPESTDGSQQGS